MNRRGQPDQHTPLNSLNSADAADDRAGLGLQAPALTLPKGGGAIRGIGEKFGVNPVTGTGAMSVPLVVSPGRSGFGPQLTLAYDSGAGNDLFGLGWSLSLPSITRKTAKGLPQYDDAHDSDVFLLSGTEDLVPALKQQGPAWLPEAVEPRTVNGKRYRIRRYRPRVEGLFARIERWTNTADATDVFWRSISKDNVTTWYGKTTDSRIADPADKTRIFRWLICESYDGKGNLISYTYNVDEEAHFSLQTLAATHEYNRTPAARSTNRYLKTIRYGNHAPYMPVLAADKPWPALPSDKAWYFEVVFDYGEGHYQEFADRNGLISATRELPNDAVPLHRADPFSSYHAGFEIRTYRLCQRVLMFHHFPDQEGVRDDCLVRSTDFTYSHAPDLTSARNPVYMFLSAVTQSGYKREGNGYLKRSLPPVEFAYSQPVVLDTVEEVDAASLANLPIGLDDATYQWTDLHGEGLPGILTEQAGAWFYKRNLSPINARRENGTLRTEAKFAPVEPVALKPNLGLVGGAQFMDLAGDGRPDLVVLGGPVSGLYEHDGAEGWQPFRPFTSPLNRDFADPNLRFIDLNGDGQADILITENHAFVWHPSLAEAGFGPARWIIQALDEEQGPRLVFAEGTQSIYLADMSGDGLTDLVRIRNGEVCYWPNLGYGRFGARITMDLPADAEQPHRSGCFDHSDQFNQQRIRLADIDGSGTTDIIYLHRDGVRLYFNQSGNCFSRPQHLNSFPRINDLAAIIPLDLLGNGTACLVWSSALPGDARQPLRYVSLMGTQKPHLLVSVKNNLGAETQVQYAPSTKFYLRDKYAGTPWLTCLPFPVHVVEQVTSIDRWRNTRFTTRYSYHHGYFDSEEREFRGFGRVEQVDVEDYGTFADGNVTSPYITADKTLYQPPVKTITWYHTGAYMDRRKLLGHFADEYFPAWFEALQPGTQVLGDFQEQHLPEPDLKGQDLSAAEWPEALRACKGMLLRQEVYELDVDALATGEHKPVKIFSAAVPNCQIQRLQPQADNRHAVFLVTERETITYHYELDLRSTILRPDPRIAHSMHLRIDEYGNVQQAVTIGYPRRQTALANDAILRDPLIADTIKAQLRDVQAALQIAYVETRYTNDVPAPNEVDPDQYRLRLPYEVRTYELGGLDPGDDRCFMLDELRVYRLSEHYPGGDTPVQALAYHELLSGQAPQRRLVEHTRALFFSDALDGPLPLGRLNARALPYESYTLALSDLLLNALLGPQRMAEALLTLNAPALSGYLSGQTLLDRLGSDTASQYWRCSGVASFDVDAPQHFFLPKRYHDSFGNVTVIEYQNDLLVRASTDALDNRTEVLAFDFRVLAPRVIQDSNGNQSAVRFDTLGMPVVTAVRGKQGEGDSLAGFNDNALDMNPAALRSFFVDEYDEARAKQLLGAAGTRLLYSFGEVVENGKVAWGKHPACVASIVREQHVADQPDSPLQTSFAYSDGGGNILVKKVPAEPLLPHGTLRWVASGKTILNNKGKPVKQYEPYFSPAVVGHRFEEPQEFGVTPILYYDAAGRIVRTDAPDGSYRRVEFSPWHATNYDANDTLLEASNEWYARMRASTVAAERGAADRAAAHAGTPVLTLLDSLGREVIAVAHNRTASVDEKYVTYTKLDAEGKPLWVQDARNNLVMRYTVPQQFGADPTIAYCPAYDSAGNLLYQHSMDAGERWTLNDAAGQPLFAWNSRGFRMRMTYDELRRPSGVFGQASGDTTIFGAPRNRDLPPEPEALVELRIYGEDHPDPRANLRSKLFRIYDSAGALTSPRYDFKGNLLISSRRYARDYKSIPNWSALANVNNLDGLSSAAEVLLEAAPPQITRTEYDALNRPSSITTPDGSIYRPSFNEASLLNSVAVNLGGAATATPFVRNIDYNAKGQRTRIDYGNGVVTGYAYDPQTFRLINLQTTRPASPDATASTIFKSATVVQNMRYSYDAVGNITQIEDAALKTTAQAGGACDYSYDALYRLIAATGREHSGQTDFAFNPTDGQRRDEPFVGQRIHPNDLQGLRGYVERYRYDAVGNLLEQTHHHGDELDAPGQVNWRRRYQYARASNRMLASSLPGEDALPTYTDAPGGYGHKYSYDLHGNSTSMAHLALLRWDFKDQLCASAQQAVHNGTPETTYYVYDASGQRVRKVTESQAGARKSERLYLGGYEIYREYSGGEVSLERQTLHIVDDTQRIALVETAVAPVVGAPRIRYQLGNHLGSASVELDGAGALIAYEEYHPYGTSAFQAGRSAAEVSLKRYRYTGKERDDETGFSYHGARYYAPWLGRWASADPAGLAEGVNLYAYAQLNPVKLRDMTGNADTPGIQEPSQWDRFKNQVQSTITIAQLVVYGGAPPHPLLDFSNVLEVGPARQAFLAYTFGLPFQEPTDPDDHKEWKRGEDMAAVLAVVDAAAGMLGPPPPPHPQLVPAAGVVSRSAANPAAVMHPTIALPATKHQDTASQPEPTLQPEEPASATKPDPALEEQNYTPAPPRESKITPAPKQTKTSHEQIEQERQQFLKSGGKVQVIKDPVQLHHVASDKSSKYTPVFEAIFEKAGMSLQDKENLISIEGHKGAHGPEYHDVILRRLDAALKDKTAYTQAYKDALASTLNAAKQEIKTTGTYLNNLVTRK